MVSAFWSYTFGLFLHFIFELIRCIAFIHPFTSLPHCTGFSSWYIVFVVDLLLLYSSIVLFHLFILRALFKRPFQRNVFPFQTMCHIALNIISFFADNFSTSFEVWNGKTLRWAIESLSYEWEVVTVRAVSKHSDWLSNYFACCDWLNRISSIPCRRFPTHTKRLYFPKHSWCFVYYDFITVS